MIHPRRKLFPFRFRSSRAALALLAATVPVAAGAAVPPDRALAEFHEKISPILDEHCYDCHGYGSDKGGVDFEEILRKGEVLDRPEFWLKVLRNTRSRVMPPPDETTPTIEQQRTLEAWIKTAAFGLDPQRPDPGRVTVRRLNRTEYRNTLRDLLGVDFDAHAALPPDDVGYGFDNIGDVLNLSPMRMEKFIEAAVAAVEKGVPMETYAMVSQHRLSKDFLTADGATADRMNFYQTTKVSHRFTVAVAGEYRISLNAKVDGSARPDPQECRVVGLSDDREFFRKDYKWADADYFTEIATVQWDAGEHEVSFITEPLHPDLQPLKPRLDYRILGVSVEGPTDPAKWLHPVGYERLYTREVPPTDAAERRAYAREVLARFVPKAFRRPAVDADTVERLVDLAERTYSLPGVSFERGIAQAIVAVLASPRFLFHLETADPISPGQAYPKIDEYTLASRLSYTLWASTPDEELRQLAARGELRNNISAQVKRMLDDPKGHAFAEGFAGQWLQSRGVLDTPINSADVMALEKSPASAAAILPAVAPDGPASAAGDNPERPAARLRRPPIVPGTVLTPEIRAAMKQEVEVYFGYIVRHDRSLLELLESDYTFVNEELAPVYGISGVTGPDMRRVKLPPGDPRGGVLTMGSTLTVTSNPTRTSPVKRGKWILENILGTPSPPPPPDIPALEDSKVAGAHTEPTQRELLALHREDALCSSCHARMDPLGLAMESFNAFGRLRTHESGRPIDPSGELATGEKFADILGLKRVLVENHRQEFYRTITEKLLTYALGRGVEYYDVPAVDRIVERLEKENGRFSTLLMGVLESAPFQYRRPAANRPDTDHPASATVAFQNLPQP